MSKKNKKMEKGILGNLELYSIITSYYGKINSVEGVGNLKAEYTKRLIKRLLRLRKSTEKELDKLLLKIEAGLEPDPIKEIKIKKVKNVKRLIIETFEKNQNQVEKLEDLMREVRNKENIPK